MSLAIKGFLETSFRDWDGLVSAVIFLGSCNWRCYFCHNHTLVYQPEEYEDIPPQAVIDNLKKYRDWIDGLCVGGGEPTLQADLIPFLAEIKKLGLKVKIDTNASQPQVIEELINKGLVDYFAVDIKAPLNQKAYTEACRSKINLDNISQSLVLINKAYREQRLDYEIRTTLAPPYFSESAIREICEGIKGAPRYVLQQYDAKLVRDEEEFKQLYQPYSKEEISAWAEIAREYIDNVSVREV